jgi:hypothetical protein
MVKEGMAFPISPCKHHVPTVECMLGSGRHHHFLEDGHACILCKSLALLLLAPVDGKWRVGINSLVEIGDVVVEIRWLICACVVWMWVTSCRKVTALRPSVGTSRAA